jgi:16S rRNA (cytidine1402-2'-O)-methyltransferase
LTKIHEEFVRGTLGELIEHFSGTAPRGEITLVVEGVREAVENEAAGLEAAGVLTEALLDEGFSRSRAARAVADRLGIPRNRAYEIVQETARRRESRERSDP